MSNDKVNYQWKFEYACIAIVFLLIALFLTRMEVSKAENLADQLEREIEAVQSEYYDLGYSQGLDDGYIKGYDDGMADYEDAGYRDGYADGYEDGHDTSYEEGYDDGYLYGYAFGIKDSEKGTTKNMDSFTKNFLLELADEEFREKPF